MQPKYTIMICFGLIGLLTFGVGFKLGQSHETLKAYTAADDRQQVNQKYITPSAQPNRVAAILLMPKSYLPLLEKFKHRKIARAIEIVPAQIDTDSGRLVATSRQPLTHKTVKPVVSLEVASYKREVKPKEPRPGDTKIAQSAAFLFLVKGAARSKLRYAAHQSVMQKAGL